MDRRVTFTGANKLFLTFTVIFMAVQLALIIPIRIYGEVFLEKNLYSILLLNQYVIILVPVLFFALRNRVDFKNTFRIRSPGLLPSVIIVLLAFPALFAASMLNNIWAYFLQFFGDIPLQPFPIPGNLKEIAMAIFVICISPGICEELLNRGIMLSGYEWRGSYRAVGLTAFMFGIFHFDITNFFGPVFLGCLIGYYVIRTDSIFAGMLAHFMNNALNIMLQVLMKGQPQARVIKLTAVDLYGSILWGVIGITVGSVLIYWFWKITKGRARIIRPISTIKKDIVAFISHWPVIIVVSTYVMLAFTTLAAVIIQRFM